MSNDNEQKDIQINNSEISGSNTSTNSTVENIPVKKKNTSLLIGGIVAFALVVTMSSILLYFNSSTKRFYRAYSAGEIDKSVEIFQESSDMSKEELTGFLVEQTKETEKLYMNSTITFEEYKVTMQPIMAILPTNETVLESVNRVDETEADRTLLINAKEEYDNGQFIVAIDIASKVSEDSVEYNNSKELIIDAKKELEKEVDTKLNELLAGVDHTIATTYLESVEPYISESLYVKLKSELDIVLRNDKLTLLSDKLTSLEVDHEIIYSELYLNEEEGKYGLLTITNDKQPLSLDSENKKYDLTPVLNNKITYYLSEDGVNLTTLLETYSYLPLNGASGYPEVLILDSGDNSLLINNSFSYNNISYNTYYKLSTEVETTSIYSNYSKTPSVHYINDLPVSENTALTTKDNFFKYDMTQKLKVYWKLDGETVKYNYYPENIPVEETNKAKVELDLLLNTEKETK